MVSLTCDNSFCPKWQNKYAKNNSATRTFKLNNKNEKFEFSNVFDTWKIDDDKLIQNTRNCTNIVSPKVIFTALA